ncbi:trehalose-binding protein [Parasaccharibacter apium]|nr:trehalose-binding protein [Parasaccharibacter apium]
MSEMTEMQQEALPPPPQGWKAVFYQVLNNSGDSQTSLSAAGCAFYATLSLFPALTALISLYGLAFDVQTAEGQLHNVKHILPPAAYDMIFDRVHALVTQPHSSLTLGLVFSVLVALWSVTASSKSILSALNIVYHAKETRGFFEFQCLAFVTTLMAVIGACLTLALMVAAPALVDYLPRYLSYVGLGMANIPPHLHFLVEQWTPVLVHWLAPAIMLFFVFTAVMVLYRIAPCRERETAWRWIFPGAFLATILWVAVSIAFSWYVAHFASYSATYGPLGAVAAVMMWLFVSAYVVLFGAVLNAELEERGYRKIVRKELEQQGDGL